jgi:hypothetical protein
MNFDEEEITMKTLNVKRTGKTTMQTGFPVYIKETQS